MVETNLFIQHGQQIMQGMRLVINLFVLSYFAILCFPVLYPSFVCNLFRPLCVLWRCYRPFSTELVPF